jgi:hypothetical protein
MGIWKVLMKKIMVLALLLVTVAVFGQTAEQVNVWVYQIYTKTNIALTLAKENPQRHYNTILRLINETLDIMQQIIAYMNRGGKLTYEQRVLNTQTGTTMMEVYARMGWK